MNRVKILRAFCALLCGVLLFGTCACGRPVSDSQADTTATSESVSQTVPETLTAPVSEPDTKAEAQTTEESGTEPQTTEPETTEKAEITLEAGLTSTDVEEVLTFYKLAAAKNDTRKFTKTLNLVEIDGGEGVVGSWVSFFEPIAQKAVEKNSVTDDPLPGDYKNIRPTDWQSAEAVSDGTYTTIKVKVVPQKDGANGKLLEGTVGRSMSVLDGIETAVNELPGVSADFENGRVELEYLNPVMEVRIDNRTGEFVRNSCRWYYRVHPTLYSLDTKVLAFNVHLQNATGFVDYTVTY